MKVAIFGSTDLTLSCAEKIADMGLQIGAVVSAPRTFKISYAPQGRENKKFSDMEKWAKEKNIPHHLYEDTKTTQEFFTDHPCDLALVIGWYHMVPKALRGIFSKGCLGLHASLLPQLRGGAPLNWAILQDLPETGVSLFVLEDGVDDGDLYGQKSFLLSKGETITTLLEKAEQVTLSLLEECLPGILNGKVQAVAQTGIPSYGAQRAPEDGKITWKMSVHEIDRLVRAVTYPYPGAYCHLGDEKITIWEARPYDAVKIYAAPGQIMKIEESEFPLIMAEDGPLQIIKAAFENGEDALPVLFRNAQRRTS